MNISDKVKTTLLTGGPFDGEDKTNPIIQDKGLLYLRFDRIVITNDAGKYTPGVNVAFMWHGEETAVLPVQGVCLDNNDSLSIVGIEGRQHITIEPKG